MKALRLSRLAPLLALFLLSSVLADVPPAEIRIPKPEAWTGQRLPIYLDIYAKGSFSGAAGISIPEVSQSFIVQIGRAVVSSKQIDGETWAVRTYEFALFSQKTGTLEIPGFKVRFDARDSFTGPAKEVQATLPSARVKINRPPGTEDLGFLITTESLDLTETWDPQPSSSAKVGDVFKRTIVQRADQMTGMAFIPVPSSAPDGFRIYPPKVATNDKTDRGQFLGERRETITYQVADSGTLTIPELTYSWWNPKTEKLLSQTLPAVTFQVPVPPTAALTEEKGSSLPVWTWLAIGGAIIGAAIWKGKCLSAQCQKLLTKLNPPQRIAARALLRACRRNDARATISAWNHWLSLQKPEFQTPEALRKQVLALQRQLFGLSPADNWDGSELTQAFRSAIATQHQKTGQYHHSALPPLNQLD